MPQFEATLSDGRVVTLEADQQPSEEQILEAVGASSAQAQEPAPGVSPAPAPIRPQISPQDAAMVALAKAQQPALTAAAEREEKELAEWRAKPVATASLAGLLQPIVPIPKVPAPRHPYLGGAANVGRGFLEGALSPAGIATLPAGFAGGVLPRLFGAFWTGLMASQVPEAARAAGQASVTGTPQEKTEAYLGLGANIAAPSLLGPSLLRAARILPRTTAEALKTKGAYATQERQIERDVREQREGDDTRRAPAEPGVGGGLRPAAQEPAQAPVAEQAPLPLTAGGPNVPQGAILQPVPEAAAPPAPEALPAVPRAGPAPVAPGARPGEAGAALRALPAEDSFESVAAAPPQEYFDRASRWSERARTGQGTGPQLTAEAAARAKPDLAAWRKAYAQAQAESQRIHSEVLAKPETIAAREKEMLGAGFKAQFFGEGIKELEKQAKMPQVGQPPGKGAGWRMITPAEAVQRGIGDVLVQDARVKGSKRLQTVSNRLAALEAPDGKVHLLSVYRHSNKTVMARDPSGPGHVALKKLLAQAYKPIASVYVDEPLKGFHREFANRKDFMGRFGNAAAAQAASAVAEPPAVAPTGEAITPPAAPAPEPEAMVRHMAQYPTLQAGIATLRNSPEKATLRQAMGAAMDELQARDPNLGPGEAFRRAAASFYEKAHPKAGAAPARPGIAGGGKVVPGVVPGAVPKEPGPAGISVGPGAASPGDVPRESQLTQLSRVIRSQSISPKEPLAARISRAVDLAGRLTRGRDRVTQALGRMSAVKDSLADRYLHLPDWTDFRAAVGRWSGADQKSALEVREFQKQLNAAVPNKVRQEAITNWIQADGDEALLRQRAQASQPNVRRGYQTALTLNEAEKTLARNIQSYLESRLQEGIEAGLLKQGVENYINQVWKRNAPVGNKLRGDLFGAGNLNPSFRFARKRIFDSYFDGEQAGLVPRNKSVGYLLSVYDLTFNRALSARGFIKELMEGTAKDGLPITMTSGKTQPIVLASGETAAYVIKPNQPPRGAVTADGRPYRALDHWALRDWKWATKGPGGQNVFVQGDLLIHPDHYSDLANALKSSEFQGGPVREALRTIHLTAKGTKLSLSPFHQVQVGIHAMAHRVNPFSVKAINLDEPVQKALVDHGLMVQDPRAMALFSEGTAGGGLVQRIPGLGWLQTLYNDMLFRDYIPRLKMAMAQQALERNRTAYRAKLSEDQLLDLTAREGNAAFGELNYRMMGRNPTVQDLLGIALLAPDFLEARARFVAQALKPYGREQRIALLLMGATTYAAARVLNELLDGQAHTEYPFSVVYQGRAYSLRTITGDFWHLASDPRGFIRGRLGPITRMGIEYVEGRDDRGIKRSSYEQAEDFAKWFTPIALDVRAGGTLPQAALAGAGVSSKAATPLEQLYPLVEAWRSKQTDPRFRAQYEQQRKETFAPSDYGALRAALRAGNQGQAQKAYQALVEEGRTPDQIEKYMQLWARRPFTGGNQTEQLFRMSLDDRQADIYQQAIAQRYDEVRRFEEFLQRQ